MKRSSMILMAILCVSLGLSLNAKAQFSGTGISSAAISKASSSNKTHGDFSIRNEESFFPFGFMGVVSADTSQMIDISNTGANSIQSWVFTENADTTKSFIRNADQYNLSVIQQLPGEGDPITDENYWANYYPSLGAYDAIVAWYLPDEIPDYDPNLEHAEDLYNWAKKYDPFQRPIYGNAGTENLQVIRNLVQFSDVIWFAAYPNYYQEPRVYVTWAMKERLAVATQGTGKPYGAMIEFFDPKSWGRPGELSTPTEIRCDTYQALIAGARGIWFYSWNRGTGDEGHEPTLNEIAKMADEIIGSGGLRDVLLSTEKRTAQLSIVSGPSQSPSVDGKTFDAIQWTQRVYGGDEYLLAVNVTTEDVSARFNTLPIQNGQATVLFEGRSIPISNGQLTDTFKAYEVHIYVVTPQSFEPEDVNQDGIIDHNDVSSCISFFLRQNSDPNITLERADVNDDGKVNAIDVQLITNKIP